MRLAAFKVPTLGSLFYVLGHAEFSSHELSIFWVRKGPGMSTPISDCVLDRARGRCVFTSLSLTGRASHLRGMTAVSQVTVWLVSVIPPPQALFNTE
jgi:hypothetical protein